MANAFKTNDFILDENVVRFYANAQILKHTYNRFTEDFSNLKFPGASLRYRLEEQNTVADGNVALFPDVQQNERTITIDQRKNTSFQLDAEELTLDKMNDQPILDDRLNSHTEELASTIDNYLGNLLMENVYFAVGNADQSADSQNVLNNARIAMNKLNMPMSDRLLGLSSDQSASLANGLGNYFNNSVNEAALMDGFIASLVKFNIYETIYLGTHVAGTGAGGAASGGYIAAGTVTGVYVDGNSSIAVSGLPLSTSGVFLKGDNIELRDTGGSATIPGIYNVSPKGHFDTNMTKTFVVTADVTSDGAGNATIPVSPSIQSTGAYKNISRLPIAGDTLFLHATHDVGIAYCKKGLVYGQPPIKKLQGGVIASQRYYKDYNAVFTYTIGSDITNYQQLQRLDVLYGAKVNPELCIRVISKPQQGF